MNRGVTSDSDGTYVVSGKLVHWALTSIVSGMVLIGAYVISWAINDREWRTKVDTSMTSIQTRLSARADDVDSIANVRARVLENTELLMDVRDRLLRLEERYRSLEQAKRPQQ